MEARVRTQGPFNREVARLRGLQLSFWNPSASQSLTHHFTLFHCQPMNELSVGEERSVRDWRSVETVRPWESHEPWQNPGAHGRSLSLSFTSATIHTSSWEMNGVVAERKRILMAPPCRLIQNEFLDHQPTVRWPTMTSPSTFFHWLVFIVVSMTSQKNERK
jgi:hypothetical protein